jgi:hypothetical protein
MTRSDSVRGGRRAVLLLALGQIAACSHTDAIIPRSDPVFARALGRMERSQRLVTATAPGTPDAQLFMMAEGLYRYRLEFPRRSLGVYFAQAAAVAIELPALQALAGSMDLFQLRLKTSDGAVQLWETLLAWYPQSPLRPLTLYRLGWAYRNTAAGGLPRESGDEAFDQLLRDHPQSTLGPLALEAKAGPWKSTEAATAWSIIPGMGQMYVGEYRNGSARLGVGLAAAAMIFVPGIIGYGRRDELSFRNDWPLLATAIGGLILLSVNYSLAYEDAIRGVVEFNEREQDRFDARHPDAP